MSRSIIVSGGIPIYFDNDSVATKLKRYFKNDEFFKDNSVELVAPTHYNGEVSDQEESRREFIVTFSSSIDKQFENSDRKINFGGYSTVVALLLCPEEGQREKATQKIEHAANNDVEGDTTGFEHRGGIESTGRQWRSIRESCERKGGCTEGKYEKKGAETQASEYISTDIARNETSLQLQRRNQPVQEQFMLQDYHSFDKAKKTPPKPALKPSKMARTKKKGHKVQTQQQEQRGHERIFAEEFLLEEENERDSNIMFGDSEMRVTLKCIPEQQNKERVEVGEDETIGAESGQSRRGPVFAEITESAPIKVKNKNSLYGLRRDHAAQEKVIKNQDRCFSKSDEGDDVQDRELSDEEFFTASDGESADETEEFDEKTRKSQNDNGEAVAGTVIEREHIVKGAKLSLQEVTVLPNDKHSLILNGVPEGITKDALQLYLETCTKIDVEPEFYFGNRHGRVLVRYPDEIKDFNKLAEKVGGKKFMNCKLTMTPVNVTNCILVTGLPAAINHHYIQLYFESAKHSGGGDIIEVKMDTDRSSAFVYFQDYRVVNTILKRQQEIRGVPIDVQPFYESIGYVVSKDEAIPAMPDPISLSMDAKLIGFVKSNDLKQLQDKLLQVHGILDMSYDVSPATIVVKPTFSATTHQYHKLVKTWANVVDETLKEYLKLYKTAEIDVAEEIWPQIKKKVCQIEGLDPDFDDESLRISLTGRAEDVCRFESAVNKIIEDLQEELELERQTITNTVTLNEMKIKQLFISSVLETIKHDHPNLQVEVEKGKSKVVFHGLRSEVMAAKCSLYETLEKFQSEKMKPTKSLYMFLRSEAVHREINKRFNEEHLGIVLSFEDGEILCSSLTKENAKMGVQIIQNSISESNITIPPQSEGVLKKNEWSALVKRLQPENIATIGVTMDDAGPKVNIIAFKEKAPSIKVELQHFIRLHTIISESVTTDRGRFKFVFKYKSSCLEKLENGKLQPVKVTTKEAGRVALVEMEGTEDDVKEAIFKIKQIFDDVLCRRHTINKPGILKLFDMGKGKSYITSTEYNYKCYIEVNDSAEDIKSDETEIRLSSKREDARAEEFYTSGGDDESEHPVSTRMLSKSDFIAPEESFVSQRVNKGRQPSKSHFFTPERKTIRLIKGDTASQAAFEDKMYSLYNPPVLQEKQVADSENVYRTAESKIVKLVKGNLLDQKADAVVNTIRTSCALNNGVISQTILKASGQQLQTEINQKKPVTVKEGDMISTGGANLHFKKVYHVCILGSKWDGGRVCVSLLRNVIKKCLDAADQDRLTSIAIPAIGTGNLNYPSDVTAKIMYEEAINFSASKPNSTLTNIFIVVYDKNVVACTKFEEEMKLLQRSPMSLLKTITPIPLPSTDDPRKIEAPLKPLRSSKKRHGGRKSHFTNLQDDKSQMMIGEICVQVKQGDITSETTDAIINSSNPDLNLHSGGGVQTAILKAGGNEISDACSDYVKQHGKQPTGSVAITSAGRLQCKSIIHVVMTPADFESTLLKMLNMAEVKQMKSISMPLLGTGVHKIDPRKASRTILETIEKFWADCKSCSLRLIRIIIYKQKMVADFTQVMQNILGIPMKSSKFHSIWKWIDNKTKSSPSKKTLTGRKKTKGFNTLVLYIYGDTTSTIDDAINCIDKLIENEWKESEIKLDEINTYEDKQTILDCVRSKDVEIDEYMKGTCAYLTIRGLVPEVMEVEEKIKGGILKIKNDREIMERRRALAKNVTWKFEDNDGFDAYDEDITGLIEMAYLSDEQGSVEFIMEEGTFRIDFVKMTETNVNDPTVSVAKVRRELKEGGISLPADWEKMSDEKEVKRVPLLSSSEDYREVEKRMKASYEPTSIKKIERIQNPKLYRQYAVEKQTMDAKNKPGFKNERQLFHGTAEDSILKINKSGFNRSFAGKHAARFGNGTYFAVNAAYSARGTFSKIDSKGNKHMYLAKVLTGEFTVGKSGYLVPPAKGNDPTDCYDSVVDNEANPSMFVVFNDAKAYPEYLITFT